MYEQIDEVSMGGTFGPVLANIIMTEFEKVVVENLIKTSIVKLYARYVDDTLLVVKRKDIDFIIQKFNSFDKRLKFTIDTFEHCVPHFLDIEICPNDLGKNTETGQYTNINSFTLWKWETSWIASLVVRAKRICCNDNLNKENRLLKNFTSWNGFPKNITNSIIKKALKDMPNVNTTTSVTTDSTKNFFNLEYSEDTVELMVKSCIKKKNDQSAIFENLSTCIHYDHIWDLFNLNINAAHRITFDVNQIRDNTLVLDRCNNWNEPLFKEALMIKDIV